MMRVLVKSRVQEFFDVNGMDVLSADSIPTVGTVDGVDYVFEGTATYYLFNSYFSGLWRDLGEFCPSYWMEDGVITPEVYSEITSEEWAEEAYNKTLD